MLLHALGPSAVSIGTVRPSGSNRLVGNFQSVHSVDYFLQCQNDYVAAPVSLVNDDNLLVTDFSQNLFAAAIAHYLLCHRHLLLSPAFAFSIPLPALHL